MRSLGNINNFKRLPAPIRLDKSEYFLVKEGEQYSLLSNICPHMGGDVALAGDHFECPAHGWKFHLNGQAVNIKGQGLKGMPVVIKDNELFVDMALFPTANSDFESQQKMDRAVEFILHSHACVEIRHEDFSILTDPWLLGPAFMGAWLQYPGFQGKIEDLHPSAIWISHEHSDHLHENTLKHFDRSTPILFPAFPNQRISRILKKSGFTDLRPLAFGQTYKFNDAVSLTVYEPESLWNDSIVLISIHDFHVLNINDAGVNNKIAKLLPPIDVLMSGFSINASGYPLTWRHLTPEQKDAFYERSKSGVKLMMKKAVKLYRAKALLPFASHFRLWHPQHRQYDRSVHENSVMEIKDEFRKEKFLVIDLLPGESWKSQTGRFHRNYSVSKRRMLYRPEVVREYIDAVYKQEIFDRFYPVGRTVNEKQLRDYLLKFNDVPEIIFCENICVRMTVLQEYQGKEMFSLDFKIQDGRLDLIDAGSKANLHIIIPRQVLGHLIQDDLSWDEATIGYWCEFDRDPDVFHAAFWRLLQAPYYKKQMPSLRAAGLLPINKNTSIADLIDKNDHVEHVLRRYGLYCGSCNKGYQENIIQGARFHGLNEKSVGHLIRELNHILEQEIKK